MMDGIECKININDILRQAIPKLSHDQHKGQCGRIGVIGGCEEYTGAPYFAAISALRTGADLSHVFCKQDASLVIKSYSPELIVHPVLDHPDATNRFNMWLPQLHAVVVGPGLGKDANSSNAAGSIIHAAKMKNLPLIIDADGLLKVTLEHSIVKGYRKTILTPNMIEFKRLYDSVFLSKVGMDGTAVKTPESNGDLDEAAEINQVKELSKALGNVTIAKKGKKDIITDGNEVLICDEEGSPRRCGGQGDLLSGAAGTLCYWASIMAAKAEASDSVRSYSPMMLGAYGACLLTRRCASLAFKENQRATLTTDLIQQIPRAFQELFES